MYNESKKFVNNAHLMSYPSFSSQFGGSNYRAFQHPSYPHDTPASILDSPRTVVVDDEDDEVAYEDRRTAPVLSERQAEATAFSPPPPSASTIYDKSFLAFQQQPPLVYMSSQDPMTPELANYLDTLWHMQHPPAEVYVSPLDVVREGATYQYNPDPSHLQRNYKEAIAPFTTSPFLGDTNFSDADGSPYTSPIVKYEDYDDHHTIPLFGNSIYDHESDARLQEDILCGVTPKVEASPSSLTATPVMVEPHNSLSIDTALPRTADALFSPSPSTAVGKPQVNSPDSSDAYEEDEELSEEDDYQPHRTATRGNTKRNVRDTYATLPGSSPTASRPRRTGVASSPIAAGAARRLRFVRAPTSRTDTGRAGMIDPTKEHNFRCRFECPDYFTSAYECKRHQEDHHAKHQAQELIASVNRGVEHFTLGNMHWILLAGTRGSSRNSSYQRETFNGILKKYHLVQEKSVEERMTAEETEARWETIKHNLDQYIEGKVVQQVLDFARQFVQKYVCPSCGLDFSRTDSKQRHMAHNHRS